MSPAECLAARRMYRCAAQLVIQRRRRLEEKASNARKLSRVMITDHQSTPSVDIENYVRRGADRSPHFDEHRRAHRIASGPARTEEGELPYLGADHVRNPRCGLRLAYRISITDPLSHCSRERNWWFRAISPFARYWLLTTRSVPKTRLLFQRP